MKPSLSGSEFVGPGTLRERAGSTGRHHEEVKAHYRGLAAEYDSRANRTCDHTYVNLIRRTLGSRDRLLEIGSGSNALLRRLNAPFSVGCDLSLDMLRMGTDGDRLHSVVAAGEHLPFVAGQFDGVFLINVLEHIGSVEATLRESARVLTKSGLLVAVTPNGNWEFWLDLAERWQLKLPEGPHVFLTPRRLRSLVEQRFEVLQHQTFLLSPIGPPALAAWVDRVTFSAQLGLGFFQFIVAQKRDAS